MNIFLTGGTGLVGSHLLRQALAAGHIVKAVRRSPASKPRIPIDQQPEWLDRQLDEVTADQLKGCDVLIHLAAHSAQYPYDTLANCLRWNLTAVLDLFEQARLAGICHFIVAGSCFEYGLSRERYQAIPTDAPLEPTNSYAASKATASIALSQWAEEHHIHLEILRVFHVYGEGEAKTRFWPSLRRAALAGEDFPMTAGEQIRDFIPVERVARLFLERSAKRDSDSHFAHIYNVGTGKPRSLVSFAQHWWATWNAKGRIVDGVIPYRNNECIRYVPGESILSVN